MIEGRGMKFQTEETLSAWGLVLGLSSKPSYMHLNRSERNGIDDT